MGFCQLYLGTGRHHLDSLRPDADIPGERFVLQVHINEMLGWGDLGFYLCLPWPALGGNSSRVVGTEEQKALLKKKFDSKSPPGPAWP
jgi:hypothetical protein